MVSLKLKIFLLIFLMPLSVYSQAWMKELPDKKSFKQQGRFYQLQEAFDYYWQGKEIEKGKGWKQFKRWENFMEPRVYPEGNMSLPPLNNELKSFREEGNLPANWQSLGPDIVPPIVYANKNSGAGRLNAVAFHPANSNIMWVGAPSGGVWKTTDKGRTWKSLTDDLFSIGVSDIAVNPSNPNLLYIATGDGDGGDTYGIGILKSRDGGETWETTGLENTVDQRIFFRKLLIDPSNPNIMIAASNNGIYRTEDGFESYSIVRSGHFKDIEFQPGNPDVVYAASYNFRGVAAIYRSTDNGNNFSQVQGIDLEGSVSRIELAVTLDNPDVVYALASDSDDDGFFGLYKSDDAGLNFNKKYGRDDKNLLGWSFDGSDEGGQGWYDLSLAVSPTNEDLVFVGGVNVWRSSNSGKNFSISAHWIGSGSVAYVHADHHMLKYNTSTGELFSANDGGLYYTDDKGFTWNDISEGLNILQIYRMSASKGLYDLFITGNQDNGSMKRINGEWSMVTGGDGMDNLIDPDDPDRFITSYYYGTFFKTNDGGENFKRIGPPGEIGEGAWITPLIMDKNDPDRIYAGYNDLYLSKDFGDSWIKLSENLTRGEKLRHIGISESSESYIYTATYSRIWITRNNGISWENISAGLPELAITSIEVAPENPELLWVTLSGYKEGHKVYRSDNGGATWINYSEGLPNLPANIILYERNTNKGLYVGTDIGVYYRNANMQNWELFNTNMPNVIINDLEIQYNFNRIIAATYGRGLWASPLNTQDNAQLYGELYTPGKSVCLGDTVEFFINTIADFDSISWNINNEITETTNSEKFTFTSDISGIKNIYATVYKDNDSAIFKNENYFKVIENVELDISSLGTDNYHKGNLAYLFASGAEEFTWDPQELAESPFSPITQIYPTETTDFIVTGITGNCVNKDTITIIVQPGPINDDVCGALPLEKGINGPFSNLNATANPLEPLPDTIDCNTQNSWCNQEGGVQNSVWFTYEAEDFRTSFITEGFDTQIAIYKAENCEDILNGKYTLLAANDDYYGSEKDYAAALNQVSTVPGEKYFIQVDGSAGGATGEFTISIYDTPLDVDENFEMDQNTKLLVYPNPFKGNFTLEFNSEDRAVKNISIFDLSGRLLFDKEINATGNISKTINFNKTGVFLIRVRIGEELYYKKLISD